MSAKNCDKHNRWRNKIVSFRMSPQEAVLLDRLVNVSGLNKQEYLINRALQLDIVIKGNPKVFIGLKKELIALCKEFQTLSNCTQITEEQQILLNQIIKILNGLRVEND